jgi:hypothetical protein
MISEKDILEYRRRKVANLVKEVSDLHGGDSAEFLQEYIAEVLHTWANDLQSAITCFEELKKQALNRLTLLSTQPALKTHERTPHKAFRKHYEQQK